MSEVNKDVLGGFRVIGDRYDLIGIHKKNGDKVLVQCIESENFWHEPIENILVYPLSESVGENLSSLLRKSKNGIISVIGYKTVEDMEKDSHSEEFEKPVRKNSDKATCLCIEAKLVLIKNIGEASLVVNFDIKNRVIESVSHEIKINHKITKEHEYRIMAEIPSIIDYVNETFNIMPF